MQETSLWTIRGFCPDKVYFVGYNVCDFEAVWVVF